MIDIEAGLIFNDMQDPSNIEIHARLDIDHLAIVDQAHVFDAALDLEITTKPIDSAESLVRLDGLSKTFDVSAPWLNRLFEGQPRQFLTAVDDISLKIPTGRTFSLVGESGMGCRTSGYPHVDLRQ